ncbi:protein phosphatase 2C homolog 2 [[Candida] anglica]|uniref:protein-serine/threonine phosphatase n=1 Tax=[Candida] anglica TaxID=148631 RepID=A0ABP0EAH8_9ASCO
MGQILSQPVTEKHSEEGGDSRLAYGLSCMQGWRINMEDAHATILSLAEDAKHSEDDDEESRDLSSSESNGSVDKTAFFGVYDGHGGEKAAIFTGKRLHGIIRSTDAYKKKDYVQALKDGFLSCDQAILRDYDMRDDDSGCAATSTIITEKTIYCGNAGDSRTIMSINGLAKALSYDHKPSNEGEKARICSAGGYVDMGRVNGNLALSRGIGDFEFKKNADLPAEEQIVTCYPDVLQHTLDYSKDEFVVLACDGIWDCLTSQQCVECVRRGIKERTSLTKICEEIMELCCAPTSDGSGIGCDNMSIVIVALLDESKGETLEQWYDKIIARIELAESDPNLKGYGHVSPPYDNIYKDLYGEHYSIGQQSDDVPFTSRSNLYGASGASASSRLRNGTVEEQDEDEESKEEDEDDAQKQLGNLANDGAISLQKLLASNAITNENGVIYLDTSSAQSLLAHFGMSGEGAEEEDGFDGNRHIEEEEEVEEEDEQEGGEEKK